MKLYRRLRRALAWVAACLLGAGAVVANAEVVVGGVDIGPLNLSAHVADVHFPGPVVVFDHTDDVFNAIGAQKAEELFQDPKGGNSSGHSTSITQAFGSSAARADFSGGVGVSAGTEQGLIDLDAGALFSQAYTNTGQTDVGVTVTFFIPSVEVGLIGISSVRELAQATATLVTQIVHPDGSSESGIGFTFGLVMSRGPAGFGLIARGAAESFLGQIQVHDLPNGFATDPLNPTVFLGTLKEGDRMEVDYQLDATERQAGVETAAFAFVGDPFDVNAPASFVPRFATPVPEPGSVSLLAAGLAWLGWRGRRRTADRSSTSRPRADAASPASLPEPAAGCPRR